MHAFLGRIIGEYSNVESPPLSRRAIGKNDEMPSTVVDRGSLLPVSLGLVTLMNMSFVAFISHDERHSSM
eukprot:g8657.t1